MGLARGQSDLKPQADPEFRRSGGIRKKVWHLMHATRMIAVIDLKTSDGEQPSLRFGVRPDLNSATTGAKRSQAASRSGIPAIRRNTKKSLAIQPRYGSTIRLCRAVRNPRGSGSKSAEVTWRRRLRRGLEGDRFFRQSSNSPCDLRHVLPRSRMHHRSHHSGSACGQT